jgi:hypothetical protein
LLRETDRLIVTRWTAVIAVAAALLQHERFEPLEIYRIVVAAR